MILRQLYRTSKTYQSLLLDENGHRVVNIPAMTTYSEIKKVGNDVYLENPGARLRLGATNFTINNNKLYYLENEQGKLKTGYLY